MTSDDFRSVLLCQLKLRNKKEGRAFSEIVRSHNKLFESFDSLKSRIRALELDCTKLREENLELSRRSGGGSVCKETDYVFPFGLSGARVRVTILLTCVMYDCYYRIYSQ
jgi:hypothetical protein